MWAPTVVCHQLRSPENLGAIARVMANFGATRLILSDPLTHDFRGAEKTAVEAAEVLRGLAVAKDLPEALSKQVYALGTTSRTAPGRHVPLTPEEGARRLAEHAARGPVALVLGGEKRGLSNDELSLCHDVVVIPTPGPQPSMNVAQAAAVLLYTCARAGIPEGAPAEPGARGEVLQALEGLMQQALLEAEFLNPQAPQHVLRELTRSLVKGRLSQREAELWRTAFEHLLRGLRKAGGPTSSSGGPGSG